MLVWVLGSTRLSIHWLKAWRYLGCPASCLLLLLNLAYNPSFPVQNTGPKWILFNLAGLYWRIVGNNYHALECFRRAIYTAPVDLQDVPEINMANVLYRWGKYADARFIVFEARRRNEYEVGVDMEMEFYFFCHLF